MDSDQTFDISLPIGLTQTVDLYLEQEGDCTYSQDPQRENDRSWSCLESNTETSLSQQVKRLDSVLPLANKECVYNLALGSVVIPDLLAIDRRNSISIRPSTQVGSRFLSSSHSARASQMHTGVEVRKDWQ